MIAEMLRHAQALRSRRLVAAAAVLTALLLLALFAVPEQHVYDAYSNVGNTLSTITTSKADQDAAHAAEQARVAAAVAKTSHERTTYTDDLVLADEPDSEDNQAEGFANATLGLQKIFYINLETRVDRENAFRLQSALTGLRAERVEGITTADVARLRAAGMKMPVSRKISTGETACLMSHVKVWQQMLSEDLDSALIFEADAAWDRNIRGMMHHLSHGIEHLMKELNFLLPGEGATRDDPLLSRHWDVLQLGGCWKERERRNLAAQYYDPFTPSGFYYYEEPVRKDRRIVRFREEASCTVAYALSRSGVRKVLLRATIDMNDPVDWIIKSMIHTGQLRSYSVWPTLVDQWKYRKGLGADGMNSDIRRVVEPAPGDAAAASSAAAAAATAAPKKPSAEEAEKIKATWKKAHKDMSVWTYGFQFDTNFTNGMLDAMRDEVFDWPYYDEK